MADQGPCLDTPLPDHLRSHPARIGDLASRGSTMQAQEHQRPALNVGADAGRVGVEPIAAGGVNHGSPQKPGPANAEPDSGPRCLPKTAAKGPAVPSPTAGRDATRREVYVGREGRGKEKAHPCRALTLGDGLEGQGCAG